MSKRLQIDKHNLKKVTPSRSHYSHLLHTIIIKNGYYMEVQGVSKYGQTNQSNSIAPTLYLQ